MFVLKALAEKGKNIVDKTKKNITQLSSKIYDYATNTSLAHTINKYYRWSAANNWPAKTKVADQR
jgi:hypothetical protein